MRGAWLITWAATIGGLGLPATIGCTYDFGRAWTDGPTATPLPDRGQPPGPPDAGPPPPDVRPPDLAPPPPPQDTGIPDAPAQAPSLCYSGVKDSARADCPAGWSAIAGATDCVEPLVSSVPSASAKGWQISCQGDGTPVFTEVICIKDGAGLRRVTASAAAGATATATCASWEVVVGGGCACGDGAAWIHDRQASPEGWACACTEGAPTAHASCLHQASGQLIGLTVARQTGVSGDDPQIRCSGQFVVTGGCAGDRTLVGGGLGDTDDAWRCGFLGAPTNATLTAICIASPLGACP